MKKTFFFLYRLARTAQTFILASFKLSQTRKKYLETVFEEDIQYELFITNRYGGGTSVYTNNYCKNNKNIMTLQNTSYGTDFCFELKNTKTRTSCILNLKQVKDIIHDSRFSLITVNTLISYLCMFEIMSELERISVPVKYFVHDFHCICPSFNLIKNNTYCNLHCNETEHCFDNVNYFLTPHCKSIVDWRKKWSIFLQNCAEIRCFSTSSKDVIKRIYPTLNSEKITVIPHDMSYCDFSAIANTDELPLHIGIVGSCATIAKGKLVIEDLLKKIDKSIPVTFLGTSKWRFKIKNKNVQSFGRYEQQKLKKIIEDTGVSLILFPSIWPETFSYLVSEEIMMNIPIICFDLGAQAEKVRAYKKGYICKSVDEMAEIINRKRR